MKKINLIIVSDFGLFSHLPEKDKVLGLDIELIRSVKQYSKNIACEEIKKMYQTQMDTPLVIILDASFDDCVAISEQIKMLAPESFIFLFFHRRLQVNEKILNTILKIDSQTVPEIFFKEISQKVIEQKIQARELEKMGLEF